MVYSIYTDGSVDAIQGVACSAFLIIRGRIYICSDYVVTKGIPITVAESIAVGQGLKYLIKNHKILDTDTIAVHCDSKDAILFCRKCLKAKKTNNLSILEKPKRRKDLVELYNIIFSLNCSIVFYKEEAHRKGKNPNSYVDRLAKVGLR